MMSRGGRAVRVALLLACTAAVLLPAPAAAAPEDMSRTYPGPEYSRLAQGSPTETQSQSKLWFLGDAWWALMAEPAGPSARVHELMPDHTWRPTSAVVNTNTGQYGDALREGEAVHVVTRSRTGDLEYARLAYDAGARDYRVVVKQIVTEAGGNAPPTVTRDGAGRLWTGYANGNGAVLFHSDDDGATWSEQLRFKLATGDAGAVEVGELTRYDDRVGFLWSNQQSDSFQFASHRDGDPPELWKREVALAGQGEADNHISLVRVPGDEGDTLLAAVKTAQDDAGAEGSEFLIKVLVRAPGGTWSQVPAATIGDELTDPLLQLDLTNRRLYLIAASEDGDVVIKDSSLDDLGFEEGLGSLLVLAGDSRRLINPSGSDEPLDARTGLVVLADDVANRSYRHGEMPLGSAAPVARNDDGTPPEPPLNVRGGAVSSDTVVLSWSRATDGNEWVPAADAPPVSGYVVARDGVEIGTMTETSFRDAPRGGAATDRLSVVYEVTAVDEAGNRSDPVAVTVDLPPAPSRAPVYLGIAALVLAGLALAYRLYRRAVVDGRMAQGPAPEQREPELTATGGRPRRG
jgi:hypothetical protein